MAINLLHNLREETKDKNKFDLDVDMFFTRITIELPGIRDRLKIRVLEDIVRKGTKNGYKKDRGKAENFESLVKDLMENFIFEFIKTLEEEKVIEIVREFLARHQHQDVETEMNEVIYYTLLKSTSDEDKMQGVFNERMKKVYE